MSKIRPTFKDQEKVVCINRDWRDAFLEEFNWEDVEKVKHAGANAIKIIEAGDCTIFTPLINYVSQFYRGGFWYSEDRGLYFVTNGVHSDNDATYEDAKQFITAWRKN